MEIQIYSLVFLGLFLTPCQGDYTQKSFQLSFPSQDHSAYARLQNTISSPLHEFTLCYWVRVRAISTSAPVFSYAISNRDNEVVSTIVPTQTYRVYRNIQFTYSNVSVPFDQWTHLCTTWSSYKNTFKMFHNGMEVSNFVTGTKYIEPVSGGGIIIIGQEQDSLGGGFALKESLNGDVSEIHVWDHILCPNQISLLAHCSQGDLEGNVISWRQSSFTFSGEVIMKPVTLCAEMCSS